MVAEVVDVVVVVDCIFLIININIIIIVMFTFDLLIVICTCFRYDCYIIAGQTSSPLFTRGHQWGSGYI